MGLILGLALLFGPIHGSEGSLRRDLPVGLLGPALTAVLTFDGTLSGTDGWILLGCFLAWLTLTILDARKERSAAQEVLSDSPRWQAIAFSLAGLVLLVLAGSLIVAGAKYVGTVFGWSTFVTGALLVSVGTSAPELATTLVSRLRRHDEIGLGTVLGSNVFNGLFIVAVAAIVHPIRVDLQETLIGLGFGIAVVAAAIPDRHDSIGRSRGFVLLGLYAAYLVVIVLKSNAVSSPPMRGLRGGSARTTTEDVPAPNSRFAQGSPQDRGGDP